MRHHPRCRWPENDHDVCFPLASSKKGSPPDAMSGEPEAIKLALWKAYHWYLQSVDCAPKGEFFVEVERLCDWKGDYNRKQGAALAPSIPQPPMCGHTHPYLRVNCMLPMDHPDDHEYFTKDVAEAAIPQPEELLDNATPAMGAPLTIPQHSQTEGEGAREALEAKQLLVDSLETAINHARIERVELRGVLQNLLNNAIADTSGAYDEYRITFEDYDAARAALASQAPTQEKNDG